MSAEGVLVDPSLFIEANQRKIDRSIDNQRKITSNKDKDIDREIDKVVINDSISNQLSSLSISTNQSHQLDRSIDRGIDRLGLYIEYCHLSNLYKETGGWNGLNKEQEKLNKVIFNI
jgi:hypothetical protein